MAPTRPTKAAPGTKAGKTTANQPQVFYIDYSIPVNDKIFDTAQYEKYLQDHIKLEGRTGQLGDKIKTNREPERLAVICSTPFSKRSLKYLTKKYLKKNQMREWLRVVATSKDTYSLKFFNVDEDEGDADSDA